MRVSADSDLRPPPRIFGIRATRAPVVAVLCRGPSDWCRVGRWDLETPIWEPGSWLRGRIFPQRCDLSPDGRWLAYCAHRPSSRWAAGTVYSAISRLPWLQSLAAWGAGSTYTRGVHFTSTPAEGGEVGEPDVGSVEPCLRRYGLAWTRPVQFAVERRRGWVEAEDSDPRRAGDSWDVGRTARMTRTRPGARPGGGLRLHLQGRYAAFREGPPHEDPPLYALRRRTGDRILDDVQWADWDDRGRLLVATVDGRLQIRDGPDGAPDRVVFDEELAGEAPDPRPPPPEARSW